MSGEFFQDELMVLSPRRGKSAYDYAVEGGYTGTPEEFAVKLAALMNDGIVGTVDESNNLVITGALTAGTYTAYYELTSADGTKSLVEIGELTLAEDETDEPEPVTYTVTWVNYDGTVLETDTVTEGETPTYDGATPTRVADSEYTYTFTDWTPTVVAVTADATYTAVYEQTANETESAKPTNFAGEIVSGRLSNSAANNVASDSPTHRTTDYAPVVNGDIVQVSGYDTSTGNVIRFMTFDSDKVKVGSLTDCSSFSSAYATLKEATTEGATVEVTSSSVAFVRFSGLPSGTDAEIIVNIKRNGEWL